MNTFDIEVKISAKKKSANDIACKQQKEYQPQIKHQTANKSKVEITGSNK